MPTVFATKNYLKFAIYICTVLLCCCRFETNDLKIRIRAHTLVTQIRNRIRILYAVNKIHNTIFCFYLEYWSGSATVIIFPSRCYFFLFLYWKCQLVVTSFVPHKKYEEEKNYSFHFRTANGWRGEERLSFTIQKPWTYPALLRHTAEK